MAAPLKLCKASRILHALTSTNHSGSMALPPLKYASLISHRSIGHSSRRASPGWPPFESVGCYSLLERLEPLRSDAVLTVTHGRIEKVAVPSYMRTQYIQLYNKNRHTSFLYPFNKLSNSKIFRLSPSHLIYIPPCSLQTGPNLTLLSTQ